MKKIFILIFVVSIILGVCIITKSTTVSANEIDMGYNRNDYDMEETSTEIILTSKRVRTANSCSDLGSDYVKVGTENKGKYLGKTGSYKYSKRKDFTSGDYFYDFKYGIKFWSKKDDYHKKYQIYDKCKHQVKNPMYLNFDETKSIKWEESLMSTYGFWSSNKWTGGQGNHYSQYYFSLDAYIDIFNDMDKEYEKRTFEQYKSVILSGAIGGELKLIEWKLGISLLLNPYTGSFIAIMTLLDVNSKINEGIANDKINSFEDVLNSLRDNYSGKIFALSKDYHHARANVYTNLNIQVVDINNIQKIYSYSKNNKYSRFSNYTGKDKIYGSVKHTNSNEISDVIKAYFKNRNSKLTWN